MIKKIQNRILFLLTFVTLLIVGAQTAYALAVTDGKYTNIYGNITYANCVPSASNNYCQSHHSGSDCNLQNGTCKGGNNKWVYKFTCAGEKKECRSNGWDSQGTLSVTSSTTCGQTVQLDVFNEDCNAGGGWSCDVDENGDGKVSGAEKNNIDYIVWYSGDCPASTPSPSPSPDPTPVSCNTDCSNDSTICQQAIDSCTYCNPSTDKCETPPTSPSPSPSSGGTCNQDCTPGTTTVCDQAQDGCTFCNPGTNKCEQPPGGGTSPSPSPPFTCNSTCLNSSQCAQDPTGTCTYCNPVSSRCETPPGSSPPPGGSPGPSASPQPTPTTPPDFNTGMCKCEDLLHGPLYAGQTATFTARGSVEGDDRSKAKISNISFQLVESGSVPKEIENSGKLPAAVNQQASSGNKTVYEAAWSVQIPSSSSTPYKVFANLDCQRNTQANAQTQAVLAVEDDQAEVSIFGKILNFFKGLFNSQEETATIQTSGDASIQQEQIRLDTLTPANVTYSSCSAIHFEIPSINN